MDRRTYLAAIATAVGTSGCAERLSDDVLVARTVTPNQSGPWPFDAEAGTQLKVELEISSGAIADFRIDGPGGDELISGATENNDTWTTETEKDGTHKCLAVASKRANIAVRKA